MEIIDFLNIIKPEHYRTSCSDENISNGFYIEGEGTVSTKYLPRCKRCAYLEIINKTVDSEDEGVKHYFKEGW